MLRPAKSKKKESKRLRYKRELERLFEEYKAKLAASDPAYGGSKKKALMDRFESSMGAYDAKDFSNEAEMWRRGYKRDPNKRRTLSEMSAHNPELKDPSKPVLRPGESPSMAMARYSKKVVDDKEGSAEKASKYGLTNGGYVGDVKKLIKGVLDAPSDVASAAYGMLTYSPPSPGVYARSAYGSNKRMEKRARASSRGATVAEREAYANGQYEFRPGYFKGPKVKSPDDVWEELKRTAAKKTGYRPTKADIQEKAKF